MQGGARPQYTLVVKAATLCRSPCAALLVEGSERGQADAGRVETGQ